MVDYSLAALSQFLRFELNPLRALHPFPQHPLVARQARQDGLNHATHQWYRADNLFWREQACMGHVPIHSHVPRYLDSVENSWRSSIACAGLARNELFGSEYAVEYP